MIYIHGFKYDAKRLVEFLKKQKNTKVVYFAPDEYYPLDYYPWTKQEYKNRINHIIKKNKINFEVWIGNYEKTIVKPLQGIDCKIINWSNFWIYATYAHIERSTIHADITIDRLFCSLNNYPHVHRCMMIDNIFERCLDEYGYITWHREPIDDSYKFKHFHGNVLKLDDFCNQFHLPDEYFKSLFILISESSSTVLDISEKTFTAIHAKKPFILFGAPHIHKVLKELGFKTFDNVFDYSFDDVEDINIRLDMILDQLEQYKMVDYQKIQSKIQDTCEYNYQHMLSIIRNKNGLPDEFYNVPKSFVTKHKFYKAIRKIV